MYKIGFFLLVSLFFLGGCAQKYEVRYEYNKKEPSSSMGSGQSSKDAKMRPYTIFGKTYYPSFVKVGEEFSGIASWYGSDFHGGKTASGEIYDMHAYTAAHKTLPMNTIVSVTNLNNNQTTIVRINDRGPFVDGRIIDLSYSAAKDIGIDKSGTAPVRIKVLGFDGVIANSGSKEGRAISNIAVQIGAFRFRSGADDWAKKYSLVDGRYKSVVKTYDYLGAPMYRVMLTGFESESEARDFIKEGRFAGSFFVSLD